MNRRLSLRWFFSLMVLTALLTGIETAAGEPRPLQLLVLPFQVNSENDLRFMQDGIFDILASRLSLQDKVVVLNRHQTESALELIATRLDQKAVAQAGKRLNADYVLWGSLTEFGESLSMDATILDMSGGQPPMFFFAQSASDDEVIPAVSRLAAQINRKVFGRETYVEEVYEEERPKALDIHTHPEKLIEQGFSY